MEKLFRLMGAVKRDPAVEIWFEENPPELSALARSWFKRMQSCGRDVRELMHDGLATACVDDAPFGYVGIFKAHINVGFFYGAALNDPARLLEGTGKRMRHAKLKPGEAVESAALQALIMEAYTDIKRRLR